RMRLRLAIEEGSTVVVAPHTRWEGRECIGSCCRQSAGAYLRHAGGSPGLRKPGRLGLFVLEKLFAPQLPEFADVLRHWPGLLGRRTVGHRQGGDQSQRKYEQEQHRERGLLQRYAGPGGLRIQDRAVGDGHQGASLVKPGTARLGAGRATRTSSRPSFSTARGSRRCAT